VPTGRRHGSEIELPDTLSTEQIRRLIFKHKWGGGGFMDLANFIGHQAVADKLLDQTPQFHYSLSPDLETNIIDVAWEMIFEGIYVPGYSIQDPGLSRLRLTEYGRKCFDAGGLTPHDPNDYLKRLKAACPKMDATSLLYVEEALGSFKAGRFLAAAVMIGVAAESMLQRLADAVSKALDTPDKQTRFEKATKSGRAKTIHDEVMKCLTQPTVKIPWDITGDDISVFVSGIFSLIRQTRNASGHPSGRRLDRNEANALLLLFPTYGERVEKLIEWLKTNQI
jgi:hypothetical protein